MNTDQHSRGRYVIKRPGDSILGTVEAYFEGPAVGTEKLPFFAIHSPDGWNFGYHGSGPAELALSILAHYAGVDPTLCNPLRNALDGLEMRDPTVKRAWKLHQDFKRDVIAVIPQNVREWSIPYEGVSQWVADHERNDQVAEQLGGEPS